MAARLLCAFIVLSVSVSFRHPEAEIRMQVMKASWYNAGSMMANGERFDPADPSTVAHRFLPFGTRLQLINPQNGKSIYVRVADRGPYVEGRQLDVTPAGARALGFLNRGTAELEVTVLASR